MFIKLSIELTVSSLVGAVHKRRPSQREGGSSDADVRTLVQKKQL